MLNLTVVFTHATSEACGWFHVINFCCWSIIITTLRDSLSGVKFTIWFEKLFFFNDFLDENEGLMSEKDG